MDNKPSFMNMLDQLSHNSSSYRQPQTGTRMGRGSIAPPLEAPTRNAIHNPPNNANVTADVSSTPPINANGNGTNQDHHPLSRSDSHMSTPPKVKLAQYPRSRVYGIQPSPSSPDCPMSPPSMGMGSSPATYSPLNRSGSTEFSSPRGSNMGISPRPKGANVTAPIPIVPNYHSPSVNNYPSPTSSPSPSPLTVSIVRTEVAKDGSSKLGWLAEAIKKHPEVLQIMERVRPLGRASSFGRTYNVAKTPSKEEFLVGKDHMIQLVLQHLQYEGLHDARKMLEEEASVKYVDPQLTESRLLNLLRMAVRDTERVWELTLSTASEAPHLLEEHLGDLSLLQEDPALDADDVNIWDEAEEGNILYTDETPATSEPKAPMSPGAAPLSPSISNDLTASPVEKSRSIKAASLNRLIAMLALEEKHDIEYMKTFLLTYQSFTTPAKLLQKLIQRYHVPIQPGMSDDKYKQICVVIQLRVVNVLKFWINNHYSDFNDKLLASLKLFIDGTLRLDTPAYANMLTTALNAKRPEAGEEKKDKTFNVIPPEPKIPKNIFSLYLDLFDVDEEEIARQMTLIDFEIYSSIKMSELLNQSWNKPKLRHRSPNVIRMINRFNDVSHWVVTSILRQEKIRDRARTMAKLVRIADYMLKTLNNFNSAMAILAGFNAAAVHRLKHTREEMPRNIQITYDSLQHTLDSNQAYKGYRTLLSNANPPCIPYLGIYLTDLTFIDDGNPDFIGKLINFGKRKLVYTVIDKVKQYQQAAYNLQPVYQIGIREVMDDDKQFKLSLAREPRNAERSEIQ